MQTNSHKKLHSTQECKPYASRHHHPCLRLDASFPPRAPRPRTSLRSSTVAAHSQHRAHVIPNHRHRFSAE